MSKLFKRTKILATIGPAVNSQEKIEELIMNGVNGCRFNCSHGTLDERMQQTKWIREAARKKGRAVAILFDLQGPKVRLGELKDDYLAVKAGDELILDHAVTEHDGSKTLPVQYNLAEKCHAGEPIYLFDGSIKAQITDILSDTAIKIKIENDGELASKKGINLPETDFGGDIITERDQKFIDFVGTHDCDYVSLSFVQSADDINQLRERLAASGSDAQVIAKIETKAAISSDKHLEEIVKAADGIMVARGDLAVEAGAEVVPVIQRRLVELCREHTKLCIVATQMLGSMVHNPEPTRAEVSDVANAVIQGADVTMLSDETANGDYPVEAVKEMRKVILYTQNHAKVAPVLNLASGDIFGEFHRLQGYNALAFAAVRLAEHIKADLIICQTSSGATSAAVSGQRPSLPIMTVTTEERVAGQLALSYGTSAFVRPYAKNAGIELAKELKEQGYLHRRDGQAGDLLTVIVSGNRDVVGATDTIKVRHI